MNALFNSKILGMFVFLLALSNKALGAEQNINFDDLQRAGAELFKTIAEVVAKVPQPHSAEPAALAH